MARKTKVIEELGAEKFENSLNSWLESNPRVNILNITHSTSSVQMNLGTKTAYGMNFSALLVYEEYQIPEIPHTDFIVSD